MNSHYNQNYTKQEIDEILDKVKNCVYSNRYTISLNENRQENIARRVRDWLIEHGAFNHIHAPSPSFL